MIFSAKIAVGYLLDELKNDITKNTPASFEPSIDYVVTKIPRFAFEKFPQADPTLTTQMKSVGEAMAIGRTFKESLQKCLRSLEIGRSGLGGDGNQPSCSIKSSWPFSEHSPNFLPLSGRRSMTAPNLLNTVRNFSKSSPQ